MVSKELKAYGKAGAVSEEVISAIRTVLSYNGQERETQRSVQTIKEIVLGISVLIYRYERYLNDAKKSGVKKSAVDGITNGFILLLIYGIFALGIFFLP